MSVINQMLKDLDKQQGKKGPAVVSQRPSLPRPRSANSRKFLLIGLALVAVALWLGSTKPTGFTAIFSAAKTPLAPPEQLKTAAPEATAPETTAVKNASLTATAGDTVVSENSAAPEITQPEAAKPQTSPETADNAVSTQTQLAESETELTGVAQTPAELQLEASTETAAPAATATIPTAATTQTLTVLPVVTTADAPDSNSYPATKPSEFVTDMPAEAAEKAPSSMQVETVVFDAKLQLQRLAEQAGEALHKGQWQQLQQQAQQYIQLAPAEVQGYQWLAESYRQLQQWQPLQQLLQLCRQQNLQSDLLWLQQGRLASQLKNWPQAEQALQNINPSFAAVEVLQLKANALQQQQKLADALVAWQQLTTLQPGVGRGWLGQALVLDQQGESQQAKRAYQQALTTGGLSAATVQFIQQRLAIAE